MIKKLVIVPKNEHYYFCKRLFFSMFGDIGATFAECIESQGWVGYPYYNNSIEEPNILLFANKENFSKQMGLLDYSENGNIYTKYRLGVIITDKTDISVIEKEFFDEVIDLSSLLDYYKTELSLKEFIKKLLDIEIKDVTSHLD